MEKGSSPAVGRRPAVKLAKSGGSLEVQQQAASGTVAGKKRKKKKKTEKEELKLKAEGRKLLSDLGEHSIRNPY